VQEKRLTQARNAVTKAIRLLTVDGDAAGFGEDA
jgi:hypothetical protein